MLISDLASTRAGEAAADAATSPPAGEDPGLTAIDDAAGAQQADESSNTVAASDSPDVIGSYTQQGGSPREQAAEQVRWRTHVRAPRQSTPLPIIDFVSHVLPKAVFCAPPH